MNIFGRLFHTYLLPEHVLARKKKSVEITKTTFVC